MRFDLYAAGASQIECCQFLRDKNYNCLLSQFNDRSAITKWINYFKENPECKSKLFIDSGAYSAHTKGITIDVDDYIEYINSIDEYVYVFAQVDKIPGEFGKPKTEEQLLAAPKESWDNYLYMVERVKSPKKLLPVFHQGEDFKWLHNMLNYQYSDGTYVEYIGISPANDLPVGEKAKWLDKVWSIILSSPNPKVKTHAFGMTTLSLLEKFPFTSADSTSWLLSAAYGNILFDSSTIYVSEQGKNNPKHIDNKNSAVKEKLIEKCKEFDIEFDDLQKSSNARMLFNLHMLDEWASSYKCKNENKFKVNLF